jgi:hypothetical protein
MEITIERSSSSPSLTPASKAGAGTWRRSSLGTDAPARPSASLIPRSHSSENTAFAQRTSDKQQRTSGKQVRCCELRVVLVALLEARLKSESEYSVLSTLAHKDSLLTTTVRTSEVRCALVSYKQEKGTDMPGKRIQGVDGTFDAFTLDGSALRGIVAAARSLGAEAVWLDAWCYRSPNGAYNHEDFCSTLNDVIEGVCSVVWLPRSKERSPGHYPYRPPKITRTA